MFYDIALYTSLIIFGLGMIYKISAWFRRSIGINSVEYSALFRFFDSMKGILKTLFSLKIFLLLKVFILDVLLQMRILRENFLRWLMHTLIYVGFMLLLLMHAMDGIITEPLFADYYSTINPFMFFRDLAGFMVIVGIGIALYRRFFLKVPRLKTNAMDCYIIIILAIIMISGILLEGLKITSYAKFQEMVEDYSDTDEEQELQALEAFWVDEFNVVSPGMKGPFDEEALTLGMEQHDMSCAACHSNPKWAFTGNVVAGFIRPFALAFDKANVSIVLYYIHFLACFIGLAYLPFSKMFHVFAGPVSLMTNAVMDIEKSDPANIMTRQVMELDACTHCGTCNLRCSVAVALHLIDNINILPSEKMVFLKTYIADKELDDKGLRAIQEGIYLCTNCDRCTVVCPVGINLRDLWFTVREAFIQENRPISLVLSPFSFYRGLHKQDLDPADYSRPMERMRDAIRSECELINNPDQIVSLPPQNGGFRDNIDQSFQAGTYSYCFSCENCTTVCPVVQNYEDTKKVLGLLPHQIMRSVGLGLKDLAIGSGMLWNCLTCYQCQEHCPQEVKVTDIFYELKNQAIRQTEIV